MVGRRRRNPGTIRDLLGRSSRRLGALGLGVALASGLLATGCASSGPDGGPRDLLDHVADDGSLVDAAFDPDRTTRLVALRSLARMPADANSELVLERVRSERDPEILGWLAFAAARWDLPASTTALRVLAAHPTGSVRAAGVAGLGRLADDSLTTTLTAALSDQDGNVRRAAALALFRLDGRRYEHERLADEAALAARDVALTEAALTDPDPGVRWRAIYAMAGVHARASHGPVLARALSDHDSPLARIFALRGLGAQVEAGLLSADDVLGHARPLVDDADDRVTIEAARLVAGHAPIAEAAAVAAHARSPHARRVALEALRPRIEPEGLGRAGQDALSVVAHNDPSSSVRREARAVLAADGDSSSFTALLSSRAPRDRVLAATLLADGQVGDPASLAALLADPEPSVVAAALAALGDPSDAAVLERLIGALDAEDPAIRGTAAEALAPLVQDGRAPPHAVSALANVVAANGGYEFDEARMSAARALGLPGIDPSPPSATATPGTLLEVLLGRHAEALLDPAPRVLLATSRGDILLELHRVDAPVHVENFLELAAAGVYDGLDIHRVVPNFVVQGLDPRADGWGVGGRRVPDEFTSTPFLTGTLGMPHAGSPHTGGCQIFLTHLPTPHLDTHYTVFGHVVEGLDVLAALEVDDVVESVTRVVEGVAEAE